MNNTISDIDEYMLNDITQLLSSLQ